MNPGMPVFTTSLKCDLTGRLQLLVPMVSDYRSVIANVREFYWTLVLPGYAVWLKDRVYERPYWPRGPFYSENCGFHLI
jgi:hypothetical protein